MTARTLFAKVWDGHVVAELPEGPALLYVDLHLVHEVTSPQAFESLRQAGRRVRRPELTVATVDHNVPTGDRRGPVADAISARQLDALASNAAEFGVELFDLQSPQQGIVHVIGPELGLTQPGMVIVCGDSHTATHGAFGALALGIGTSEVEHVLATQCLVWSRPGTMEARLTGTPAPGVTAKDLILALIGRIGTAGATGHVIEYTGEAIRRLSMEERMTVCNMSIEAGARAGMIAPDETTFAYLAGRPRAPAGAAWDRAVARWRELRTDPGATYDKQVELDASTVAPQVTWGTSPGMVTPVTGRVPDPGDFATDAERSAVARALEYMGLTPGTPLEGLPIDRVFLGSCTNARIEDLRAAARVVRETGRRHVARGVRAMVVPGSQQVKAQAEREGLDRVFSEAGFEWRNAGCSMCLGMNADVLQSGERCASTSNRNFEGRQGRGGRTHLMSPPGGGGGGCVIEPFVRLTGKLAALPRANVDTDQIIPKQFLKRVERTGFGPALFHDWRFRADGTPNPDFELNAPAAQGASLLLTWENFGCGSSREHAVWALREYGFRAILAPSFADIFFANCCQNGLVPVRLLPQEIGELFRRHRAAGGEYHLTVDLEEQRVEDGLGFRTAFTMERYRRDMLLRGLDVIGRTLLLEERIGAYERSRETRSGNGETW